MSAHTPGPWRIVRTEDGFYFVEHGRMGDPAYLSVACIHGRQSYGKPRRPMPLQNAEADAKLISAAPEMLAALRYVRDRIETGQDLGMGVVLEAIAKAEGRS